MFLNLYRPILPKQRRLAALIGLAIVICLWCLYLPPTPHLFPKLPKEIVVNKPPLAYHLDELKQPELSAWNLPEVIPAKELLVAKPIIVPVKKSPPQVKKVILAAPSLIMPSPPPPQNYAPPLPTLPKFIYLGQLVDQTGIQLFFNLDDSNVMMRPNKIYDSKWRIFSVTNDEIQIEHIPSQQIIRVNRSS